MSGRRLRFFIWLFFELLLPTLFVIALWPIGKFLLSMPLAYERAFSSADLLPLGALILIGAIIEVIFDPKLISKTIAQFLLAFATFVAICLLFTYGFMKTSSFSFEFETDNMDTIKLYASISVGSICFCGIYATLLKLTALLLNED